VSHGMVEVKLLCLTSTIPWLTPTHAISPSHMCPWSPCGSLPSTACFSTRTCSYSFTLFQLAQAIFEPNLFPYKHPNILNPSHSSYLPSYEDETECFEVLAYKIRMPGNYPEESIQHAYCQ